MVESGANAASNSHAPGELSMPLYYFILKTKEAVIPDEAGVELPDSKAARTEANAIARELMRNRELSARTWRLAVCDDYLIPCFEILFAEVDETIAHLPPQYRKSIEVVARLSAALDDAFKDIRASLVDVRATLARADRMIAEISKTNMERKPGGNS